jgi:CRISPR-associated Csx3 family protein
MITFNATPIEGATLVEMTINGDGVLDFAELPQVLDAFPDVPPHLGVILSGRLPIPAYCAIAHHLHPTAWVAIMAPAAGGAVVVQSHKKGFAVGQVVSVPKS